MSISFHHFTQSFSILPRSHIQSLKKRVGIVDSGLVLPSVTCLSLQMLARLLKSSHPEDLRAANKLIKEMVQEVMAGLGYQGRRDGCGARQPSRRSCVCVYI